jgi:molybdate transport system ATP-binding protein
MNTIKARVNVNYPDYALGVDLDLPGEGITALFGTSGAGKTTLLRAIAGLMRGHDGCIRIGDEVWQDDTQNLFVPTHQRPLGFVFQDVHLFAHLDVQRNLDYGLKRVPASQRRISLEHIIELLGIDHLLHRAPLTLSGGERQRVGIARALATSPRVLLLDEPLAALDLPRKLEIMPYLERLNHTLKIPMLYVSHALDEVARLANHMVLLKNGKAIASGNANDLLTRLDLPLAHGDMAAAIIEGQVVGREENFQLACIAFSGGKIYLPNAHIQIGQRVRLRIQARDVSLMYAPHTNTSILNNFKVTITDIADDTTGQVMVGLDAGGTRLLGRITQKSAYTLGIVPGISMYAQIKGIAIV